MPVDNLPGPCGQSPNEFGSGVGSAFGTSRMQGFLPFRTLPLPLISVPLLKNREDKYCPIVAATARQQPIMRIKH